MNVFKKVAIMLTVCLVGLQLNAHNPQIASYNIKKAGVNWVINISLAQAGLHNAVVKYCDNANLDKLMEIEYKRHIVEYFRHNISMTFNNTNTITLGEGGLRLGSHQTDLKFVLNGMPDQFDSYLIHLGTLQENKHQTNILKVYHQKTYDKFLLTKDNGFTARYEGIKYNTSRKIQSALPLKGDAMFFVLVTVIICALQTYRVTRPHLEEK